jgi:Tfp pilus assembly protein PilN
VGLPALILSVALCGKVVRDRAATNERRVEVERLRNDMSTLRSQRADLERFFSDPGTRLVTERAAFLNTIIDERSFPWTQFFLDLEHRLPGGVRILSLAPVLSGDHLQVKMRVAALSDKSKLEFLKALEKAPEFSALELVSESRPGKGEEGDAVQVDLTADYRAVSPPPKSGRSGGGQ